MKIYFAGMASFINTFKVLNIPKVNILESYYYMKKYNELNILIDSSDNFFLDSGAFSAWSQKEEINIDEYIEFIKLHDIKIYAVLDVIGNPEKTIENQNYMESKGLNPIPCYHYGEDYKYLDYYCSKYDYIALGGMVPISTKDLINWLDVVFSKYPNKRFHGFGMTTFSILDRYDWYSVDSTAYLSGGKTSSIFVGRRLIVASNNPKNDDLSKLKEKDLLEFKYMCNKYGFTRNQICQDTYVDVDKHQKGYIYRILYNIYYLIEFQDNHEKRVSGFKQPTINDFFT
jgi:hypothetical protein